MLERAGDALAARGRDIIAGAGEFPNYPEEQSRDELDRKLSAQAAALLPHDRGIEGGYLVLRFKSFLGTVLLGTAVREHEAEHKKEQSRTKRPRTRRSEPAAAGGRPDRHPG